MRQGRESERLEKLIWKAGVVRARDLLRQGFDSKTLTRLVRQGRIQRLGRGLYATVGHALTEWHDLAELAKSAPRAVIGLVSALAFHEMGTQRPNELWIVLPAGARTPTTRLRLRTTRFAEPCFSAGIEEHRIEGATVRVYAAAKTVADCFKMRSKVGSDVAVEGLRDGWRKGKFTMDELMRFAKLNRVENVMRPYIEAIVG